MTQTQADQQLCSISKKFLDFLMSQQEVKAERISSYFDSVRQINVIYPPIEELHQTRPELIKQIVICLKGFLAYPNLVDVIYKTIIQTISSISYVVPSPVDKFKDIFGDYFFRCNYKDKDSAIDFLLATLSEIRVMNPSFWWYLLCTYEISDRSDPYLLRLKMFLEQFVKKQFPMISLANKNTLTYLIYQFESESSSAIKLEIIKNALLLSMPITPKFVDESKNLSSVSVFDSESKSQTFQILQIIYNMGKETFASFLKVITIFINQLDLKRTTCISNDQPIDSLMTPETWAYELLRFRYILHLSLSLFTDKREFSVIFKNVISEIKNESIKILLIFAIQLDSHDNVIITANSSNQDYVKNVIAFIGHLSVIFAPIFLKINDKEIITFSESCKNKNKRLKIFTKEAKFMEESSKICTDPLRLEKLLCEMESTKCHIHSNSPSLLLSLKTGPEWQYEEALNYVNTILDAYRHYESELVYIFISRIAVIQSFLINQGLGIDHHFLAKNFFDRCLTETTVERIRSAFMIVESSSFTEDFTEEQCHNWVQFLVKGFQSNDPLVCSATSKVFLHCLTHLTAESFCLIELFLKVNPNPQVDYLTTLTSIYSLCLTNESIDKRTQMMETIMKHFKKFINELPRNEVTLGLLTTLLFEEVTYENTEKVSTGLTEAFDIFLNKDEQESGSGNEPPEPLRMLSIFPNYFDIINKKYPTFFNQLIDCIVKIVNNPKTDLNLFQLLADTLVDTILLLDNSDRMFGNVLSRINLIKTLHAREDSFDKNEKNDNKDQSNLSNSEVEKCMILLTCIDQFMARSNQPYKDLVDSKIPIPGTSKVGGLTTGNLMTSGVSSPSMIGTSNAISAFPDIEKSNFCAYIINSRYSILKVLFDESAEKTADVVVNDPSIAVYAKTMTGSYGYNVKLNKRIMKTEDKEIKEVNVPDHRDKLESDFNKNFIAFAGEYFQIDQENFKNFEETIEHSYDQDIIKDFGIETFTKFETVKPFEKTILQPVPITVGIQEKDEGAEVLYPSCQATAFFESIVLDSQVSDQNSKKCPPNFKLNYEYNQSDQSQSSDPSSPTSPSQSAADGSNQAEFNEDAKNANYNDSANPGGNNESLSTPTSQTEDHSTPSNLSDSNQEEEPGLAQLRMLMEKKKKEKQLQKQMQMQNSNPASSLVIKNHFPLLDIASSNIFSSPLRETIKIGFLYVKNGQADQNSILQNRWDQVSPEFRSFIASIGKIIDLSTHQGFSGKLDNSGFSNGRYQLYFSTNRLEVMYHVAPLLPTDPKDVQQIYKKRHIGNDNVHVVWSEHAFDYEATTITSQFNDAHIIIYPIPSIKDFFRVVIYRKSPDYHFGPLNGEGIVSARALPDLVRWTSVFSDRVSRMKTSTSYKLPNQLLSDSIRDVLQLKQK